MIAIVFNKNSVFPCCNKLFDVILLYYGRIKCQQVLNSGTFFARHKIFSAIYVLEANFALHGHIATKPLFLCQDTSCCNEDDCAFSRHVYCSKIITTLARHMMPQRNHRYLACNHNGICSVSCSRRLRFFSHLM